jgi:Uma2 family endonuclease
MIKPSDVQVTEAAYLEIPESPEKIELVDGELVVTPPPSYSHQVIAAKLVGALMAWAAGRSPAVTINFAPVDIRFGAGRILQPDVIVFFDDLEHQGTQVLDRIPELCIEILSPKNRSYDRTTKRYLYAEAGVEEYWIVDPVGLVERRTGTSLEHRWDVDDVLHSDLLPGFELPLSKLFDPKTGIRG